MKGLKADGGMLYLTGKRLIFKPHKLNTRSHQVIVPLSGIKSVDRYKSLGFINNGISVATVYGIKYKFVVEKADKWLLVYNGKKNISV